MIFEIEIENGKRNFDVVVKNAETRSWIRGQLSSTST